MFEYTLVVATKQKKTSYPLPPPISVAGRPSVSMQVMLSIKLRQFLTTARACAGTSLGWDKTITHGKGLR